MKACQVCGRASNGPLWGVEACAECWGAWSSMPRPAEQLADDKATTLDEHRRLWPMTAPAWERDTRAFLRARREKLKEAA